MKKKNETCLNRRELIKLAGVGAASIYFGGCTSAQEMSNSPGLPPVEPHRNVFDMELHGPFDRTIQGLAPRAFSGDEPGRAHKILWNKSKFLRSIHGIPTPTEKTDVVVVGGGISGILSTYFLKDHRPILLEQASRFGGNSRGESWQGLDYSLATAYFGVPEQGSAIDTFFNDIGITPKIRIHDGDDPIYIDGKRYDKIWQQGTNDESRPQFKKLNKHFLALAGKAEGHGIPRIPPQTPAERDYVNKLDRVSMKTYLEEVVEGPLHPHVEHVIEHYFWSAASASYTEVSAAMGLNFFVGDFSQVAVTPGGNGAIAEATLTKILKTVPAGNLRTSSLVFDVRVVNDGVQVTYLDSLDNVKSILAKTVIMSCPKFVAARLIDDLEQDRGEVIKKLRYRSYIVGNLMLEKHIDQNFYDLFMFKSHEMKVDDIKKGAIEQKITDMVYGNFTEPQAPKTILTLFRGFPYDDVRSTIYRPEYYEKVRKEFEEQIYESILPMMGLAKSDVADLRLARWGHPLPLSQVGNFAKGRVDILRRPFKNRVFFVEQDNWTLPAFECAFSEAKTFSAEAARVLKS